MVIEKQNKIKEKMTYKYHGKDAFWDMIKWRLYFKAVPQELTQHLNMENFDLLKSLFLLNDQIDIILENLSLHFLLNDALKEENTSMYGVARDLFH